MTAAAAAGLREDGVEEEAVGEEGLFLGLPRVDKMGVFFAEDARVEALGVAVFLESVVALPPPSVAEKSWAIE